MTKKEEKPKKELPLIKGKRIGTRTTITYGKTVLQKDMSDEDYQVLSAVVKTYNKSPSEYRFDKIRGFFKDKKAELEVEIKGKQKVVKKKIREVKIEKAKAVKRVRKVVEKLPSILMEKGGEVYLKEFPQVSMPPLLVQRFIELYQGKEEVDSLINFWYLCLLNPNPIARTKLFDYISRQNMLITPAGYFVTYRMVKNCDKKRNPLSDGIFTDAHTGTMTYKEGTVASIPRSECDEDGSKDCSRGLHTGTAKFIGIEVGEGYDKGVKIVKEKKADNYGTGYSGYNSSPDTTTEQKFDNQFGNQAIICLVNPAHVVSVPDSDTRKMRSCEFYFAKLTTAEEVVAMEKSQYLVYEHAYRAYELEDVKRILRTTNLVDIKEKNYLSARLSDFEEDIFTQSMAYNKDRFNNTLTILELQRIIQKRTIKLKK